MSVSVKRDYHSELRTAQARQTRRSIVSAAARLFVNDGYGATTIDAVAEAAGVSRKTVFTAVGGKLELLKAALDWAIAGDDLPVPLADRPVMRRLMEQNDPVALISGWAKMLVEIDTRVVRLFLALEVAAGLDAAANALLVESQRQRLDGAQMVVERLAALDALNRALSRDEAVDVAWLATDPALFDRLVRLRGWSTKRFQEWVGELLQQLVVA